MGTSNSKENTKIGIQLTQNVLKLTQHTKEFTMTYRLEKTNENGKQQYWECTVKGNQIFTKWGVVNGREQTNTQTILEGKNIGKANEKTPAEQAHFEAERSCRKKMDKGYKMASGKLTQISKTAKETFHDVPEPMLAIDVSKEKHAHKLNQITHVDIQAKLDGTRMLFNRKTKKMYSRRRKEIIALPGFEKQIADAFAHLDPEIEWIDGELYSHELSFNELQSILRKSKSIDPEKVNTIEYHVFDVMNKDPWEIRREWLKAIMQSTFVKVVPSKTVKVSEIKKYHDQFVEQGYEGIMLRTLTGLYQNKRSNELMKFKVFFDEEFKITNVHHAEHNANKLGAIECITKEGVVFTARPAMTDTEKDEIWKNRKKYIGKWATVKFQEKTEAGAPRFPSLKGIRNKEDM